ncbi:MAG: CotH kinase family protein [Lachnospiraceae bacterium]|nr:CotH kinase family protein [Lachnospiraceae bacterium]
MIVKKNEKKNTALKVSCLIIIIAVTAVFFFGCAVRPKAKNDIFDTKTVHRIDVSISKEDWDDLLTHPIDKTKYKADLSIDGEKISNVSFATKGSTSLFLAANDPENRRYSFKINFGHFEKGQTWHGSKKLNLQSSFADATYMKDYLSYWLFREMDVPAPQTGYVWITINGEDQGLYLAVEEIDKKFMDRESLTGGSLYKPEDESDPEADKAGMPVNSSGADLVYTDDDINNYDGIFADAIVEKDPGGRSKVIKSLKGIRDLQNLEDCLDTEEISRYFAVHNFVCNYDSYIGPKSHNFDLYERDGKLKMLPWDYNLAFGAFPSDGQFGHVSDSTWVVNQGIDTPLICVTEDKRPMWRWIVSDEKYLDLYHKDVDRLLADCFESGAFEKKIDETYEMILPYVEKDPTAYYSPEDFKKAYSTLKKLCSLRAKSIRKQLDDGLSTRTDEQEEAEKIDASDLLIKDMGIIEE